MKREENIYMQLSKYISLQYPDVIYHFDTGSGMNLTIGQAKKQRQ